MEIINIYLSLYLSLLQGFILASFLLLSFISGSNWVSQDEKCSKCDHGRKEWTGYPAKNE